MSGFGKHLLGKIFGGITDVAHEVSNDFKRHDESKVLQTALIEFFGAINFETEAETIRPENEEICKQAFLKLCQDMQWFSVEQSFLELLEEKSGEKSLRKDGITPNWYHEFRQVLPVLSGLQSELYTLKSLGKYGGIEPLLIAKLRHDSYEDFGKTPTDIYARIESRLHGLNAEGKMTDAELLEARHQATIATDIVRLVSKKTKMVYMDEEGEQQTIKRSFFDDDDNRYYIGTLEHYFSFELKTGDGIEGTSTSTIPSQILGEGSKAAIAKNIEYARHKRTNHGHMALDTIACEKWPEFETPIRSLDSMLGLNLVMLEITNEYYDSKSTRNPQYALAMRVDPYIENAMDCYAHVPKGFQPHLIQLERLETIARDEIEQGKFKMAFVLENVIYPSLTKIVGDRRGTLLPKFSDEFDIDDDNGPSII